MRTSRWLFAVLAVLLACGSAQAQDLTDEQKRAIDHAIAERGLNAYGDAPGTMYMGGTPLFDERTGQTQDRHQYIMRVHPELVPADVIVVPRPDRGPNYAPPADRSSPPPTR